MKLKFKLTLLIGMALMLMVSVFSCSREYDVSKLDKTVTMGGESFMMPLASTSKMNLSSLLDSSDLSKLTIDDEGNYFYQVSDTIHADFDISELEDKMATKVVEGLLGSRSVTLPTSITKGQTISLSGVMAKNIYELNFAEAGDEGLKRLDSVTFDNKFVLISGKFEREDKAAVSEGLILDAKIKLPERYNVEGAGSGNVVEARLVCDASGKFSQRFPLNSLTFKESSTFKYSDTLRLEQISVSVPSDWKGNVSELESKTFVIDLSLSLADDEEKTNIVPSALYGLIDVEIESQTHRIPIEDVPETMQDAILDLSSPFINASFISNAGIPVDAKINYHSVMLSSEVYDFDKTLGIQGTKERGGLTNTNYYLADSNRFMPTEGYEFVKTPLRKAFYVIPDTVVISAAPEMNQRVPQHVVWFGNYDYFVKGVVTIVLPFIFGSDMCMFLDQTISGLPEAVGTLAADNDLSVVGMYENAFPENIRLRAELLDSNGHKLGIYGIYSDSTDVRYASDKVNPERDTIYLNFEKNSAAKEASIIRLHITMLGSDADRCIDSTDYLFMNLKLMSSEGGLTFNLDSLNKKKK